MQKTATENVIHSLLCLLFSVFFFSKHSHSSENNPQNFKLPVSKHSQSFIESNNFNVSRSILFGRSDEFNRRIREYIYSLNSDSHIMNAGCGSCGFSERLYRGKYGLLGKKTAVPIFPYVTAITPVVPERNDCEKLLRRKKKFRLLKDYFQNLTNENLLTDRFERQFDGFDMIVDSVGVVSYSGSVDKVLSRYISLLRPGGKAFIRSMNSHRIFSTGVSGSKTLPDSLNLTAGMFELPQSESNALTKIYTDSTGAFEYFKEYSLGVRIEIFGQEGLKVVCDQLFNCPEIQEPFTEVIATKLRSSDQTPFIPALQPQIFSINTGEEETESKKMPKISLMLPAWLHIYRRINQPQS